MAMTTMEHSRVGMVLLASMMAFSGCAVGTAYVSVPARLTSAPLPPLIHLISFDVCRSPNSSPTREALGDRIRKSLSRAGVTADLSGGGSSPVDVTVTVREDQGPGWSALVSLLTLSVVPGYFVERTTLDVDLAWPDAGQVGRIEHLRYQSRVHRFIWLPLIVGMDFFLAPSGVFQSSKVEDGGFEQMVERLGDDIRARLAHGTAAAPVSGAGGVLCPSATAAAGFRSQVRPGP
jgi:hypothetical protein